MSRTPKSLQPQPDDGTPVERPSHSSPGPEVGAALSRPSGSGDAFSEEPPMDAYTAPDGSTPMELGSRHTPKTHKEPFFRSLQEAFDDPDSLIIDPPEWVGVEGDDPLLYEARSHILYGESTSGKSLLTAHMAKEVATDNDVKVAYLDFEDTFALFAKRIISQGLPEEHADNILYKSAPIMSGDDGTVLRRELAAAGVGLVVVDSLAAALAMSNVSENENDEIRKWFARCVMPLDELGIASVFVDHVGHEPPGSGSGRKFQSRGGTGKRDAITGASYRLEATTPISLEPGVYELELFCAKDRLGYRSPKSQVAKVFFTVDELGWERFSLRRFDEEGRDKWLPTAVMEMMSKLAEDTPEGFTSTWFSSNGASKQIDKRVCITARDELVSGGYVKLDDGPRGAKLIKHVKPFREDLHEEARIAEEKADAPF